MPETSADIKEKRAKAGVSSAAASPEFSATVDTHTQEALQRIGAQALDAVDDDDSHFVAHRYRHESGLIAALRDGRNMGLNVEAEMAHFSSSVAQHVREKIAEMGPAFLTLSVADLDRLAHDICRKLHHDDADDDDGYAAMANMYRRKDDQDDDDGVLANFRRAAADAAEKKKQKQLADAMLDEARHSLHKETIRELLKDHQWRSALKISFDIFLHPLLHLQNHLSDGNVASSTLPTSRPASLRAPAPKGPG